MSTDPLDGRRDQMPSVANAQMLPRMRRVGWALVAVGIVDIAFMVYAIASGWSYSSSFNVFAVIGGVFLFERKPPCGVDHRWIRCFSVRGLLRSASGIRVPVPGRSSSHLPSYHARLLLVGWLVVHERGSGLSMVGLSLAYGTGPARSDGGRQHAAVSRGSVVDPSTACSGWGCAAHSLAGRAAPHGRCRTR